MLSFSFKFSSWLVPALTSRHLPFSSWSKNGKTLLTASTDWNLILWDVLNASIINRIRFESPLLYAEMYPGKEYVLLCWICPFGSGLYSSYLIEFHGSNCSKVACVVCPFREQPQFVNLTTSERTVLPRDPKLHPPTPVPSTPVTEDGTEKTELPPPPPRAAKISTATAVFTRNGKQIYVGDADGHITIINTDTLQVEKSVAICAGSPIKSIVWSRDDTQYLVNSTDKSIRLVNKEDHSVQFELFDAVNKIQWKKCCFSGDGDHIVAGSAQKHEHKIYIWSRHFKNNLIRMLEGPKEGILDLVWHPLRSIAISCSTSGAVYIWNARYQESWSAFAPGFTELEENEEYIEREDEFDARDLEEEARKKKEQAEQDEDVDVDIISHSKNDGESDDDDEELFFLPVIPIPDWQMPGGYLTPDSDKPNVALATAAGLPPQTDLLDDPIRATERRKSKAKRKAPTPGPSDER